MAPRPGFSFIRLYMSLRPGFSFIRVCMSLRPGFIVISFNFVYVSSFCHFFGSVIFVNENENENGEKRENNEIVSEN